MRSAFFVTICGFAFAFACSKDNQQEPAPSPSAGSAATTDSGSADATGSAAVGSGEGSGSAADAGSAAGSGDDSAAGAAEGSDSVAAADEGGHFDKLTHDEKVKFMKQKVMPTMKPLFQKFDKKEFAKVTCKTCHGKSPAKAKYEMPSPDLPALDFDEIKAGKADPQMVEFMSKVVKPEMAKLLGEPEMSEDQPNGFGCLHCHTLKKKSAS